MPRSTKVNIEKPVKIEPDLINHSGDQSSINQNVDSSTHLPLAVTWCYQLVSHPLKANDFSFQQSFVRQREDHSGQCRQSTSQSTHPLHDGESQSSEQTARQLVRSVNDSSDTNSLNKLPLLFTLPIPSDCSLSSIVCSYGFFRLPPNTWITSTNHIQSITQTITQPGEQSNKKSDNQSIGPQATNSVRLSIDDLGPLPGGGLVRALRLGAQLADAVYVMVTEEPLSQINSQSVGQSSNASGDLSSSHSGIHSNDLPVKQEEEQSIVQSTDLSDDFMSYTTDTVICVRALFPPYSSSAHQPVIQSIDPSEPRQISFLFSTSDLSQLEQQVFRMLRLSPKHSVYSSTHSSRNIISSDSHSVDTTAIRSISRALNPYAEFYRLCPQARERGFARLFRSPSLFEDCVKTVTLCNVNWKGTIAMNRALSSEIGVGRFMSLKLKVLLPDMSIKDEQSVVPPAVLPVIQSEFHHSLDNQFPVPVDEKSDEMSTTSPDESSAELSIGVFPSPLELSVVEDELLRARCRVGYRSGRLIGLANLCVDGQLDRDIDQFLASNASTDEIRKFVQTINGFGPFASNNLCALIGRYDAHAFDSETVRHMREHHRIDESFELTSAQLMKRAQQHYSFEKYGRFIFLVYWFELWRGYENRVNTTAHKWTDRQFASFSGGGPKPYVEQNGSGSTSSSSKSKKPLQHWQLVAQQTRKRKQAEGLTSNKRPKKRSDQTPTRKAAKTSSKKSKHKTETQESAANNQESQSVQSSLQSLLDLATGSVELQDIDQSQPENIVSVDGPVTRSRTQSRMIVKKVDGTNQRNTKRKLHVPDV